MHRTLTLTIDRLPAGATGQGVEGKLHKGRGICDCEQGGALKDWNGMKRQMGARRRRNSTQQREERTQATQERGLHGRAHEQGVEHDGQCPCRPGPEYTALPGQAVASARRQSYSASAQSRRMGSQERHQPTRQEAWETLQKLTECTHRHPALLINRSLTHPCQSSPNAQEKALLFSHPSKFHIFYNINTTFDPVLSA